jgi:glutathione S-transferase
VLILDGQAIWDTMAIAETVAERWPEKELWPSDPKARAHARSICAEIA